MSFTSGGNVGILYHHQDGWGGSINIEMIGTGVAYNWSPNNNSYQSKGNAWYRYLNGTGGKCQFRIRYL